MSKIKLNVLLAKTDSLAGQFYALMKTYANFFKTKQAAFRGEKKTYEALPGTIDKPEYKGVTLIQSTVDEKLDYLTETVQDYINSLFSQEKTNSSGVAEAELVVDGDKWGKFSTLELLKLKGLLENGDLINMYTSIPVRSDAEMWEHNTDDLYDEKRSIMMSPLSSGISKTTVKESFILEDPNVAKLTGSKVYTPQIGSKNTVQELGSYTMRKYSGEWSQRQRAELLRRRQVLHTAVIEALKTANDVEIVKSDMTADKLFEYLHGK